MRVAVTKMHGARNDFVVVDRRAAEPYDLAAFARWACDRHGGIGADGVIAIEASSVADAGMRTVNPDGSEAEMCGNGIRCAARWLHEAGEDERLAFETSAGIVRTEVVACEPEYLVRVTLGSPRIERVALASLGEAFTVDLGNPHVVILRDGVEDVDLPAIAARLQRDPSFPDGTNVHVASPAGDATLRVRHWERGAGLTMACGTGAVACAAVAISKRMVLSPVDVLVPGGRLVVEWEGGVASLIGPAARVFDTEVGLRWQSAPA